MAHRQQKKKITIKTILLEESQWWKFYQRYQPRIRPAIVENIVKLLSCGHTVRGYQTYTCCNPTCGHSKIVPHTCKCRACSSCGYRATTTWIDQQLATLPDTPWQHITFTLPDTLWPLFWLNRSLLNEMVKWPPILSSPSPKRNRSKSASSSPSIRLAEISNAMSTSIYP